ncbi:hypothetical protein [Streptomyces sp. NEAU-S77]
MLGRLEVGGWTLDLVDDVDEQLMDDRLTAESSMLCPMDAIRRRP